MEVLAPNEPTDIIPLNVTVPETYRMPIEVIPRLVDMVNTVLVNVPVYTDMSAVLIYKMALVG